MQGQGREHASPNLRITQSWAFRYHRCLLPRALIGLQKIRITLTLQILIPLISSLFERNQNSHNYKISLCMKNLAHMIHSDSFFLKIQSPRGLVALSLASYSCGYREQTGEIAIVNEHFRALQIHEPSRLGICQVYLDIRSQISRNLTDYMMISKFIYFYSHFQLLPCTKILIELNIQSKFNFIYTSLFSYIYFNIMNEEQLSKFHELYFGIIAKQVASLSEKQSLRSTDSFLCSICFQPFSNKKSDDHCPMILIECGHTFCLVCIKNFKEDFSTRYKCPLDKAMSYHTVANFHLLSQISNAPKQEFRPTCEQHQGRDILFYKPNLQKFYCQQCLDEENTNNSSLSVIDGLLFIAYESQKPKLQEWIKHKVQTNLQEELGECKFLEKSQIKQSQDKLVNEYQSSKMEVIKKITAEFDAMIAKIETNFSDDVYQEAKKIKRELKQKQIQESSDFFDKFNKFLEKGDIDPKELNFQLIQGLIGKQLSHKQAEFDALQNSTTKYERPLITYTKIEKTLE